MRILALDQAMRTTGWAFFENGELKKYGSFTIKPSLPIEQRLATIHNELTDIIDDLTKNENWYVPDLVVFEDIQDQNNHQTYKKLAYCQASILLWCYFNDIKYMVLSPSEWRRINGGGYGRKREEQKDIAIQKVKKWYSIDVDSDTADAINIGKAAIIEKEKNKSAF